MTLLRKCFEYAHTITRDWIYFESGLDCRNKFITRLQLYIIFVIF